MCQSFKMNKFIEECERIIVLGDVYLENFGVDGFYRKAAGLLTEARLHEHFNSTELLLSSFEEDFNHRQNFPSLEFSDLPVTVARGSGCFIDVYFWRRRPTVIHNHHFAGAFQCLSGLNLDTMYSFAPHKELSPLHSLGELKVVRTRELRSGDIEEIDLQDKFIHQNHHHADLTVNLCFRTQVQPNMNLSNYLVGGLKFEKDPVALNRAQRLFKMVSMEDFDFTKINITHTDALTFLLNTHNTPSRHPRILKLIDYLQTKVKHELDLNIGEMLDQHRREMDLLEDSYE